MPSKIILKKSSVADKVPVAADLDYGELALNYADGKLYYKTASNTIQILSSSASLSGVTSVGDNTGIVTNSQLLESIKLVDGATSGLDADLLDGQHGSYYLDWTNVTNKPTSYQFTSTTESTSTTTGALTVSGGVGISGNLTVGGTITGTVTTASQVNTVQQTTNATYYPTFVDANNATSTSELVYTSSTLAINPSTGIITLGSTTPKISFFSADPTYSISRSGTSMVIDSSGFSSVNAVAGVTLEARNGYVAVNTGAGAGTTERVRISNTGDVGIGTNAPTRKLHVEGTALIGSETNNIFGSFKVRMHRDSDYAAEIHKVGGGTGGSVLNLLSVSGVGLYLLRGGAAATDRFWFKENGDGYLSGNFGIGTTSPTSKLSVNGSVAILGSNALSFPDIGGAPSLSGTSLNIGYQTFTLTGTVSYANIVSDRQITITKAGHGADAAQRVALLIKPASDPTSLIYTPFEIQNNSGTSLFTVDKTGNVGIGVTTPTTKLDVGGGVKVTGITTLTNTTNSTSATTGALQIAGGVGIANDLYVGGEIKGYVIGSAYVSSTPPANPQRESLWWDTDTGKLFIRYNDGTSTQWVQAHADPLVEGPAGSYTLTGNLTTTGDVTVQGTLYETSDRSLKTNIKTIDSAVDVVNKLRGVEFDWIKNSNHSYGLIAQELEEVLPFLVQKDSTGTKTINYSALVGLLVQAVKELSDKVQK